MKDIKKIYKVYGGEIISIDVIKVTPKFVWVNRPKELHYVSQIDRDHVCVTKKEAVREELHKRLERVNTLQNKLKREEELLKNAQLLGNSFQI